jgi:hypothetical protein
MKEDGKFDGSYLEPIGLFRKGNHTDTHITATDPNGDPVELDVQPLKVDGGTIFIPKRGQEGLIQLFPPGRRTRRTI